MHIYEFLQLKRYNIGYDGSGAIPKCHPPPTETDKRQLEHAVALRNVDRRIECQ